MNILIALQHTLVPKTFYTYQIIYTSKIQFFLLIILQNINL